MCLFFFVVPSTQANETLTIAVASSYYEQAQQQAKIFEKKYAVHVRLVMGSTGRLYNQIMQGAPFDVFIAADAQRPALLMQQGKGIATKKLSQGYVGLQIGQTFTHDLKQLHNPSIRHIAIANPKVAPLGQAAKKILEQHKSWQPLQSKWVYAQNALQARMMIKRHLVDAAFVPVQDSKNALAEVLYVGVVLTTHPQAMRWLQHVGGSETVAR